MKLKLLLILSFMVFTSQISFGQLFQELSNPSLTFTLHHPPILGIKVDKVAFNTSGECANQVIDKIVSDFVSNKVEVIDRRNLDAILKEHNLTLSGYIDQSTAAAIGNIIGPSALISLNINRCETIVKENLYEDRKQYNGTYVRVYISRTQFMLNASIQITDLTTGRIFKSQTFEYDEKLENESASGRPEAPSRYTLQEYVFKKLAYDVHKLFFNWSEQVSVIYYNDKTCNLKASFDLIKGKDFNGAYEQSKINLENCKNSGEKEKFLAHAYYNMGMDHFIKGEFDPAVENLKSSQTIADNSIVKDAIRTVNWAKHLSQMSTQFEEKMELQQANLEEETVAKQSNVLKNEDVISLTKSKLPESLIIQKIATSNCKFDTSTDALLALINSGVSEKVVGAMMAK
jgi:hypothetical protein